jgi:STE24 endopeptidase
LDFEGSDNLSFPLNERNRQRMKRIALKLLFAALTFVALMASATLMFAQSPMTSQISNHGQAAPAQASAGAQQAKVAEYRLPPEKFAKAKALYETHTVLYLTETVFGIVVLWLILRLRVGPALRNLAARASNNGFVQTAIFTPLLILLIAMVSLPFDAYEHSISREYGLSVQGWGSWAGDWCKAEAIVVIIAVFAVFGLFRIIRKSPRRWWFYFWLVTQPFIVLLIFVAPVILDPMFNTFEPLEKTNPQLVSAIEEVTQRGDLDIPQSRMFEMKASEKVTTYNAYVTGIGATKRVVVWDNTEHDMTIPETLYVFGHEMGHYVLDHIYKGLVFFSLMTFVGFWLGKKIVLAMLARWGERWRIRGIEDLAALPALLLILAVLSFAAEPLDSAFSRHLEHQADIYGLEVTHGLFPANDEVAASTFQKLGEKSLDYPTPHPLLVFWSYDHPTIRDRIDFVLHYHPWDTPAGPKYVK